MSIHYFILSSARTTPRTTARINVAATGAAQAVFTLFPPGGATPISDTIELDSSYFATSASSTSAEIANLFTGTGGQSALVRVETQPAGRSSAVLEQSSNEGKVLLCAPAVTTAATGFVVAIGELHRGVAVLVGNVGADALIEARYGIDAPIALGTLDAHAILEIPAARGNTSLRIVGSGSNVSLICQLAVDTGKTDMTIVPG